MLSGIPSAAFLWLSVVLFAASNSIVRILIDLGGENPIDGRNAITFCNLLFVGNMCAGVTLFAVYRKHWTPANLRALSASDWICLVVLALLGSALAPWLFFVALENTMVTNVVLVAQIQPPLVLVLSLLVFGERVGRWSAIGAALSVLGVALSVFLQPTAGGFTVGRGEFFAATAAVIYATSTIISRTRLQRVPLGIFTVFRNAVGAVFFFVAASYLYGPESCMDVTSPFLWKWMLVYGGIIVASGQVLWFSGLRTARSIDVSLATSASPVAGVLAAFLILGERPLGAQYIGGGVLVLGIVIGLLGSRGRPVHVAEAPADDAASAMEAEGRAGFKGV
jgi:drug/metabolite transporter (DMT)-like permease